MIHLSVNYILSLKIHMKITPGISISIILMD